MIEDWERNEGWNWLGTDTIVYMDMDMVYEFQNYLYFSPQSIMSGCSIYVETGSHITSTFLFINIIVNNIQSGRRYCYLTPTQGFLSGGKKVNFG